ncbi:nitrogen-fixing NifU-like protein [Rubrobacter xylanophilus DSM 9941]|uniref:Nitrogen-fixing NifU-like protein n=1 Tax=Rubrobacter xylanophilus (strain DSM 9941 / JCM 11954 / NBRC 16129 / PRD-1) TaxID=266117 RepID=Q1AXD4_RUBXD|nr:iron-sulfur cluster assembly scaffold protein [Rubrobacter xylanophilus]ABG03944.1 nitrogen-fixing NifU-like protein [Rubrobacter xylanophilus DSM 9941]
MDRRQRVARLVEHARNPRHRGVIRDADVSMPGGSPECGGSVVVYLKADGDGGIAGLSFTGQGDTISQGATDLAIEKILAERMGLEDVLGLSYDRFIEEVGRDVVGSRTRNATLGLSTIKNAVRKYRRDRGVRSA